jgi:DNA polymerase III epsilon subunit-like protein
VTRLTRAIIFDCEFATIEGSQRRFWCGPYDPDPVVVQIGAVRLNLSSTFDIEQEFRVLVRPRTRHGDALQIDPFLTELTGITDQEVQEKGMVLPDAIAALADFAAGAGFWSWGKDEFNLLAISCFVEGLAVPLPATRFGNICSLLLRAGMPYEDIQKTRSGKLAHYFCLSPTVVRDHDALDDALSLAFVLRHLLREGKLHPDDFYLASGA